VRAAAVEAEAKEEKKRTDIITNICYIFENEEKK